jgi:redox-sensitive bicupin YhaK (pirin superfamily)
MGFRSLRVINEDRVEGGEGFGTHSHRDFEIISYIVSGALQHKDSMGTTAVMHAGDVQRISAGTGISHSEFNPSPVDRVHFLQIWLIPSRKGVTPSYAEKSFGNPSPNGLKLACSSDGREGSVSFNQDADLFIGRLDSGQKLGHALRHPHAWVQLISGALHVNGMPLSLGDGAALAGETDVHLACNEAAHFLLFDLQ